MALRPIEMLYRLGDELMVLDLRLVIHVVKFGAKTF